MERIIASGTVWSSFEFGIVKVGLQSINSSREWILTLDFKSTCKQASNIEIDVHFPMNCKKHICVHVCFEPLLKDTQNKLKVLG